jgi:hypothetical protein
MMLDLTIITRKLTQGRSVGEMSVRRRRSEESSAAPSPPPEEHAVADPTPASADIDPHAVAKRVHDLLRHDLTVERHRSGRRKM